MDNIDETVDPCEDFYQFSCGSFDKNKRIEDSQSKISEFSILRDSVSYSVAGTNQVTNLLLVNWKFLNLNFIFRHFVRTHQ